MPAGNRLAEISGKNPWQKLLAKKEPKQLTCSGSFLHQH
jgi:hypothetical protein